MKTVTQLLTFLAISITCYAQGPTDDIELFTSRFGKPDAIKSSEKDKPRPLIVTKELIYKKERVKAVYFANVPIGTPPPYKWTLGWFEDINTNKSIRPVEVADRMKVREKRWPIPRY
jgi:hypothetical protein